MTDAFERLRAALADRYPIERPLGRGGMATVYLARDLRHGRSVAVKVLHPEIAAALGGERFLREIAIAANLQHPHILPLHDSGEADGFLYYVMPRVEGESLRERLERDRELPILEAVRILREVADALAYAHAHGVVHRDIKPDNVMLSGRHALVTDFGVAKAVSEATGRQALTTAGVALGTPVYMAPEQATADPHLDHRVDIYALGAMGYELLTGAPPFTNRSPQEVLAAHVTQAPEALTARRPSIGPALEQILMRCLAKRPADRWQSADDLLAALEPLATPSGGMTPTGAQPVPVARPKPRFLPLVAVGVGVVAVAAIAAVLLRGRGPLPLQFGPATPVTVDPGLELDPALSADGKFIAYVVGPASRTRLFARQVGAGRAVALTADSGGPQRWPKWSPDGSTVLYQVGRSLFTVPAPLGGPSRLVVTAPLEILGGDWSPDGSRVAYAAGNGVFVLSLADGTQRQIARQDDAMAVAWSPDGKRVAFATSIGGFLFGIRSFGNTGPSGISVVDVAGGEPRRLTNDGFLNTSPAWTSDSRSVLFVSNRDGSRDVYQIAPDGSGKPLRLTTGLNAFSVNLSRDGRSVTYAVYTNRSNVWSLPIPARGLASLQAGWQLTHGSQVVEDMDVSPDGHWLAYDADRGNGADLYVQPLPSGEPVRLTDDPADDFAPAFSPDGAEIAFHSTRRGSRDVFVMRRADQSVTQVTSGPSEDFHPLWSPDGNALVFMRYGTDEGTYVVRRVGGNWSAPQRVLTFATPAAWSPDGGRIIYAYRDTIFDVATDGGGRRLIWGSPPGPQRVFLYMVRFTPDGRVVYFKGFDGAGVASFWVVPASGGVARLLTRLDDPARPSNRVEWTTDGRNLYFTIDDRQADVWVRTLSVK